MKKALLKRFLLIFALILAQQAWGIEAEKKSQEVENSVSLPSKKPPAKSVSSSNRKKTLLKGTGLVVGGGGVAAAAVRAFSKKVDPEEKKQRDSKESAESKKAESKESAKQDDDDDFSFLDMTTETKQALLEIQEKERQRAALQKTEAKAYQERFEDICTRVKALHHWEKGLFDEQEKRDEEALASVLKEKSIPYEEFESLVSKDIMYTDKRWLYALGAKRTPYGCKRTSGGDKYGLTENELKMLIGEEGDSNLKDFSQKEAFEKALGQREISDLGSFEKMTTSLFAALGVEKSSDDTVSGLNLLTRLEAVIQEGTLIDGLFPLLAKLSDTDHLGQEYRGGEVAKVCHIEMDKLYAVYLAAVLEAHLEDGTGASE